MIFTLTIFMFFGAIHGTLVFHARSVVEAAAQEGLAATQLEGGTVQDGYDAANNALSLYPNLVDVQVDVGIANSNTEVRVVVSARVENLFIDLLADVDAQAVGPKERFYTFDERE